MTIRSLRTGCDFIEREIKTVQMLGSRAPLKWRTTGDGLVVELPNRKPGDSPFALRIFPVDRTAGAAN